MSLNTLLHADLNMLNLSQLTRRTMETKILGHKDFFVYFYKNQQVYSMSSNYFYHIILYTLSYLHLNAHCCALSELHFPKITCQSKSGTAPSFPFDCCHHCFQKLPITSSIHVLKINFLYTREDPPELLLCYGMPSKQAFKNKTVSRSFIVCD